MWPRIAQAARRAGRQVAENRSGGPMSWSSGGPVSLWRADELVFRFLIFAVHPSSLDVPPRLLPLPSRGAEPDGDRAATVRRPAKCEGSARAFRDAARDIEAEAR